jgi:mono/diheme cytochrome c family protein
MDDKKQAVEKSGLKFPHELHLNKKGVRGPEGRITLDCGNCHTPDEAGLRFRPTTMKEHCQACHSLEFEPTVTSRQVPHDQVEKVKTAITEFYAQAALTDTPIDVVLNDASIRQPARPGERVSERKRQAALAWATDKAGKITREIFEVRVCFQCHQITPVAAEGNAPATWQIAPVAITQHWLPKSRFGHRQHNTTECGKCHEVSTSKSSADIAIPGIKNCQECHGGNERTRDKTRGTCETCHGFHTGSHKAGVPVIIPGRVGNAGNVDTADHRETASKPAKGRP